MCIKPIYVPCHIASLSQMLLRVYLDRIWSYMTSWCICLHILQAIGLKWYNRTSCCMVNAIYSFKKYLREDILHHYLIKIKITGKFNQLVYNYPIRIPERFSLVIRSLLTQEGICFTLKRDFKFLEVWHIGMWYHLSSKQNINEHSLVTNILVCFFIFRLPIHI